MVVPVPFVNKPPEAKVRFPAILIFWEAGFKVPKVIFKSPLTSKLLVEICQEPPEPLKVKFQKEEVPGIIVLAVVALNSTVELAELKVAVVVASQLPEI